MSEEKKQELKALVKRLNVMDDTLFHKVAEDREVCEELLRVLLQDEKLVIISTTPQMYLRNVGNRSVILDAYCEGADGKKYAVEMQKGDDDDHQKRVRYIGSNVDTRITEKGIDFKDIPEVYLIYLTKFDVFEKEKTIYHIDRTIQETGDVVDNGFHEIYINAEINDGSKIAQLMQYIRHTEGRNESFKKLSDRVQHLREKGDDAMCEAVEAYAKKYAAETEKQSAIELFKNGASLELVLKSMKLLDEETIQEIYREVMGQS